jgi:hypothetical protein
MLTYYQQCTAAAAARMRPQRASTGSHVCQHSRVGRGIVLLARLEPSCCAPIKNRVNYVQVVLFALVAMKRLDRGTAIISMPIHPAIKIACRQKTLIIRTTTVFFHAIRIPKLAGDRER